MLMRAAYFTQKGEVRRCRIAILHQFKEPFPAAAMEFDPGECCASSEPLPSTRWLPALTDWSALPATPTVELGLATVELGLATVAGLAGGALGAVAAGAAGVGWLSTVLIALTLAPDASFVALASAVAATLPLD
jgi:hypothetical protein